MIGENIKKLRNEKNLTQEELASIINVSAKTISSWENNRNLPDINTLILLAEEFNTSIDNILGIKENKNIAAIYEKKQFKDNILKIIFIGLVFIVPIIFFWYANYVSIVASAVKLWINFENGITEEVIKETITLAFSVYKQYIFKYAIYLILMLINYILYYKKCFKTLLIINIFIILVFIRDLIITSFSINYDNLIYLFTSIIGIIWAIKLKKGRK